MNYLYRADAPPSGVSLNQRDGGIKEVLLWPGHMADLPADSDFTRVLLAQGLLTEAASQEPDAARRSAPPESDPGRSGKTTTISKDRGTKNEQPES